MKAYITAFRVRATRSLDYRVASFAGVVTQFFWGWMLISILLAFSSGSKASPMRPSVIVTYIWLQQAFFAFTALWMRDRDILQTILSGNLAMELCRPLDLYFSWFSNILAKRVASVALRFPPILIAAFFLPPPFRMAPPASPGAFALFLMALLVGGLVVTAITMFIYILTARTFNPTGAFLLIGPLGEFCSGKIVPIPLLPDSVRAVFSILPFSFTSDFPFRIWSGHIGTRSALAGMAIQLAWLAVLCALGRSALNRTLGHVVYAGG